MTALKVKAAPGLMVPKEGRPRAYISDKAEETVPDSAYYLRLVSCGDLVIAGDKKAATKPEAKGAA